METTATTTKQTMQSLIDQHEELVKIPNKGDILTGTIMEKASNAMYIDLGQVGVGVIYGKELFDDLDTFSNAKIGDTVQATVQEVDNEEGYIELSLRSATRERSWEELRRKMDDGTSFESEIIDANKGGLIVRVSGVTGFLPVSQLAPDHYPRVHHRQRGLRGGLRGADRPRGLGALPQAGGGVREARRAAELLHCRRGRPQARGDRGRLPSEGGGGRLAKVLRCAPEPGQIPAHRVRGG
jgi:predicted RNA-binding protein with RPS1 domain